MGDSPRYNGIARSLPPDLSVQFGCVYGYLCTVDGIRQDNTHNRFCLVPGGPGLPVDFYRDLVELVEPLGRVESYRQRGVWPADLTSFPRSIAEAAEELAAAVTSMTGGDGANRSAPYLLAHSFGVVIAIEALCTGLPVRGAIFLNGFSSGEMLSRGIHKRVAALPPEFHRRFRTVNAHEGDSLASLLVDYWFPRHFCRVPFPDAFTDGLAKFNQEYCDYYLGPTLFEPDGAVLNWNRERDLTGIEVPVLIVAGVHDYFDMDDVRAMHAALPDSTLHIGRDASHSPWIEAPDETYRAIQRFVSCSQNV